MEEWFLSLCLATACTLLALLFLRLSGGNGKPAAKKQLPPPGPWTLPVIGNLHHVISSLPHRTLMKLSRMHGPLMLLRLGEIPTVVVSSAEAAALVMKNNDLSFADRPRTVTVGIFGCGGQDMAFAAYGDHWRQMRKICVMELLSSAQVRRMEGIRAEEVGSLLRDIAAAASTGGAINVSEKVTALSNNVVTRAVFGGRFARQREYLRELEEALRLLGSFSPVDLFPSSRLVRWLSSDERRMKRSYGRIQRIIADVIEERKAAPASVAGDEDLLDVLLRLQQEDSLEFPLTTQTIGAVLFDIFSGATDTTGITLAWAMSELMHSPETMEKTQQEVCEVLGENQALITNSDIAKLRSVQMVIKETLRVHPPIPLVPRAAREDCIIMGYDIPKGINVYINVFAISHDPAYWNDPGDFRPERFENNKLNYNGTYFEYIPFGTGRRQCPGIQFGSSLMEMALTNFLYHFNWKLLDGASHDSVDMSEKLGITVSRRYDLKLGAIPHVWPNAMSSE